MGRPSKFSFPLPGRKHTTARRVEESQVDPERNHSIGALSQSSKAERLLGASGVSVRYNGRGPTPAHSTPTPPDVHTAPNYMTVTVSDASFDNESIYSGVASSAALDDAGFLPRFQSLHPQASSNALCASANEDTPRSASASTGASHHIHTQASSSTLRSFYDPKKSPLSVSQQTSASAVRDMALRKGISPITEALTHSNQRHAPIVIASPAERPEKRGETKKGARKKKPAKLDLSILFPKPLKGVHLNSHTNLLSPNKLVSSPAAMSSTSEYFPRIPPYQASGSHPTPANEYEPSVRSQRSHSKLAHQKGAGKQTQKNASTPDKNPRGRDIFDNAKVNVRRPPRGIKHWFEALGESDDDDLLEGEDETDGSQRPPAPNPSPMSISPSGQIQIPVRKTSLGRAVPNKGYLEPKNRSHTSHFSMTSPVTDTHLSTGPRIRNMPSQTSMTSHVTATSSKTKTSKFGASNLQDESVLSFSSSDEDDDGPASGKAPIRESLAVSTDGEGEIIIGRAQAYEVKPPRNSLRRNPSNATTIGASSDAATIDIMLSPTAANAYMSLPRYSRFRMSGHSRQPSAIPEDEARPRTSCDMPSHAIPMSPPSSVRSGRSARTSRSEPRSRGEQHKLMAVTEEEEALLEMMRRKRAAMAKHSFTEGYKTALKQGHKLDQVPGSADTSNAPDSSNKNAVSNNLLADTLDALPLPPNSLGGRKGLTPGDTVNLNFSKPTSRGRALEPNQVSLLRDPSTDSSLPPPSRQHNESDSFRLSPNLTFSPLDPDFPFRSITPTSASVTSAILASPTATTVSQASQLPSPITPGLRHDEPELHIKVASSSAGSEPSGPEEVEVLSKDRKVVAPSRTTILSESESSGSFDSEAPPLDRRIVAEQFSLEQFPLYNNELKAVRPRPSKTSLNGLRESRNTSARTSIASNSTGGLASFKEKSSKGSRRSSKATTVKRESLLTTSRRCSASDDVMAAWGSLGGWSGADSSRFAGM